MIKLQNFKMWLKKQNNLNTLSVTITTALNIGWDERANTLRTYLKFLKEDGQSTVDIELLLDLLQIEK